MKLGGQRHAPAALPRGKTQYRLYRRLGWPKRVGLDGYGKYRPPPHRDSIPEPPARSESLYRLSYPGPPFKGYRDPFRGSSGRKVKLTTYLHTVPRLRTSGAVPLIILHLFNARTGTLLGFINVMVSENLLVNFLSLLVTCTTRCNTYELYILPTLHLFLLYLSENKQRLLPHVT
jgi:hypothetical protein